MSAWSDPASSLAFLPTTTVALLLTQDTVSPNLPKEKNKFNKQESPNQNQSSTIQKTSTEKISTLLSTELFYSRVFSFLCKRGTYRIVQMVSSSCSGDTLTTTDVCVAVFCPANDVRNNCVNTLSRQGTWLLLLPT
jgi:hypothetical protein